MYWGGRGGVGGREGDGKGDSLISNSVCGRWGEGGGNWEGNSLISNCIEKSSQ